MLGYGMPCAVLIAWSGLLCSSFNHKGNSITLSGT